MTEETKASSAPTNPPADKPASAEATAAAPAADPVKADAAASNPSAQLKVIGQAGSDSPAQPKLVSASAIAPPKPAAPGAPKKEHEKLKSLKPETPTDPTAIIVQESMEIAAPVEMVWRFFLNFVKWPDWNPVCLGVRSLVQGTSFGLGWRFELRLKCGPLKLRVEPIILENTTPQVIRWLGSSLGLHGMHWFIFEKTETGSRVTSYEEFTGPLRWLIYPIRGWIRQMMRTWLSALKAQVEKQATADKKSPPLKPPE